jgi:hypothetical protein
MVTMWSSSQARRECGTLVESIRLRVRLLTPLSETTASAIRCNAGKGGKRKQPRNAGFATVCKPLQRLMHHS